MCSDPLSEYDRLSREIELLIDNLAQLFSKRNELRAAIGDLKIPNRVPGRSAPQSSREGVFTEPKAAKAVETKSKPLNAGIIKLIKVIKKAGPAGITCQEIADATHQAASTVKSYCARAASAGRLEHIGTGRYRYKPRSRK